jgi:hypothetical protein
LQGLELFKKAAQKYYKQRLQAANYIFKKIAAKKAIFFVEKINVFTTLLLLSAASCC